MLVDDVDAAGLASLFLGDESASEDELRTRVDAELGADGYAAALAEGAELRSREAVALVRRA